MTTLIQSSIPTYWYSIGDLIPNMIQYIWNVNFTFNIEWCYLIFVVVWVVVIVIYFQKLIINITPNTTKSLTMRLTRSQLTAIDQELLDFCLIEVPTFQHNFETLEAHVLTFALKRKFSTIIAVDKIDFENIVSNFFLNRRSSHPYSKDHGK